MLTQPKTYTLRTYGCQMNVHDSERMAALLQEQGYVPNPHQDGTEDNPEAWDANLVLLNTCHIREKAAQKFYSLLGKLTPKPGRIIGVAGCVAQVEGERLLKRFPQVSFIIGTDQLDALPDILFRVGSGESGVLHNKFDRTQNYSTATKFVHGKPRAFVNIMKGCNHFCSYCIVPYTRGREKSRPLAEVVADVQRMVEKSGVKEVTLLGQNVNSFGKYSGESFPQLIRELNNISGLELIRFTTSHPVDFSQELMDCFGECEKLERYIHMPLQSGSTAVLERMRREYTREQYLEKILAFRQRYPDIMMSTDIIVGFPGETDKDFQQTMDALEQVQFGLVYAFNYSPRVGTKAEKFLEDDVPASVKSDRLQTLLKRQAEIVLAVNQPLVGKVVKAWVEQDQEHRRTGDTQWAARSACNRVIHFSSPRWFADGTQVNLLIKEAHVSNLRATMADAL